jgi:hypothetical protein
MNIGINNNSPVKRKQNKNADRLQSFAQATELTDSLLYITNGTNKTFSKYMQVRLT